MTTDAPSGMRFLSVKGGPQYGRDGKGIERLRGVVPIREGSSVRARVNRVESDGKICVSIADVQVSLPPGEFTNFEGSSADADRTWYLSQRYSNQALLPAVTTKATRTKPAPAVATQAVA